jgi:hypothetical protein
VIGRRELSERLERLENGLLDLEQRVPAMAREVRALRERLGGGETSEEDGGDRGDGAGVPDEGSV